MKKLIVLALFLTACASVPPVQAEVKTFQITPSIVSIDGNPITSPVFYQILCGTVSGAYSGGVDIGGAIEHPIDAVLAAYPDGKAWCVGLAYTAGACDGSDTTVNCESPYSNEVVVYKQGGKFYQGNEPSKGVFGVK